MKTIHPRPWTPIKEVLETIKKLYFKCGGDENLEHLYILPSQWIDLLKYESISDKVYENLQNASYTPIKFFVRKISTVGIPKPTVLVIIFRFFIWLLSFKNSRGGKQYPFAYFRNVSSRKRTRLSHKESDNNGTSLLASDNETTPKLKKFFGTNINAKFDASMKKRCELIIKADNVLFLVLL